MSIWSDIAEWIGPTQNEYPGGMGAVAGVVLHIQDGTEAGTEAWQHNPAAQVSSHFLAPRAGGLKQMVDTRDAAFAEVSGNLHWISIENEGYGGQALTDGQIQACAKVLARAHVVYGVPLQLCDNPLSPGAAGLTGHGRGGAAWGGHYDCPGDPVLNQRAAIIERAAALLGTAPPPTPTPAQEDDDMPAFATGTVPPGFDAATVICPPPPRTGTNWGDVWVSFACDFGDAHLRIAYLVHGQGWTVMPNPLTVPRVGDRANPFGGPAPAGLQKVSVKRVKADDNDTGACPVSWLVEAAARAAA
jgi:hypothetical protein